MGRSKWLGVAVAAWDTAWKAVAVRRALRNGQRRWVLPLLVVNSAGILPVLFLLLWSKPKPEEPEALPTSS